MEATLKHRQVGDKGLFMSNGWRYTKADYFSISDLLSVVHPQCGGSTLGRRAGLCLLMSDGGIMKKPDRRGSTALQKLKSSSRISCLSVLMHSFLSHKENSNEHSGDLTNFQLHAHKNSI